MAQSHQGGVCCFVIRTKQYVGALRPMGDHLALSTMVYADEMVDPSSLPGLVAASDVEISDREMAAARQLIDSLAEPWDPSYYQDTHRQTLLAMIERKADGL